MYTQPTEPMGIGQVVDKAFQLTKASFSRVWYLALLSAIASSVHAGYQYSQGPEALQGGLMQQDTTSWVVYICGVLLSLLFASTIYLKQHAAASGQPGGGEFGVALRKLPATVFAVILFGIAVGVGMILLIVPGIILLISLILFQLMVLLEDKGPLASLNASHKLVWGNWWRTFGLLLLALVIVMVMYFMVAFAAGITVAILAGNDAMLAAMITMALVIVLMQILVGPFFAALVLSIYYDLKLRRQGGDLAVRVGALAT